MRRWHPHGERAVPRSKSGTSGDGSGVGGRSRTQYTPFPKNVQEIPGPYTISVLLERRVERSKDLIRSKRASLAEVTLCNGLGSQSHFTSVFRRAVGATPAEFQRLEAKTI
jgi:AraC-like DNA-binding protein